MATANLSAYLSLTRQLLNDQAAQQQYTDTYLTPLINEGRQWIASEGECIRFLTPSSSGIVSVTVNSGGSGYVAPTITIAGPDAISSGAGGATATATAVLSGSTINSIVIVSQGSGYFASPTVTVTDASGTGASLTAVVGFVNQTVLGQEVYPFSAIQFPSTSGINAVVAVRSIAMIWGTFRYSVMRMSFTKYQAFVRNYTNNYLYIPAAAAQYGQGENGSFYMYPVPDQAFPMEWDCMCTPVDLASDSDVEAIPQPWTICVPYYAAYRAAYGRGRFEDAKMHWAEFMKFMHMARANSMPGVWNNPYGRS